jgi:hypothetical protein
VKPVFVDTYYYLAVLSESDAAHRRAVEITRRLFAPTITTAWVLTEVADALSDPPQRRAFLTLLESIRSDPTVTIIPPSEELFEAGLDLFARRPDKDWSLTDCISFVVMERHGLTEVLTADHHFEQAGFKMML